ncbi:hypothetical protein L6452_32728 [Arctium lappa]|uniref:Uncharacterized protein n=1 Tax=Arctium lappa TaxID=4217 RepID=A0ACB8Z5T5_ARCLA|nr:hypothetical protein L6452_32728 [Arctium lappa]
MDTNRNLTSMAKKSLIQREKKRQKLEQKYHLIRRSSKKEISKVRSLSDKWEIYGKLQSPPRNSAPTRLHRRCFSTGRPRANYRDFGLSGQILREMVHACLLPGATRSKQEVRPPSNFSFFFLYLFVFWGLILNVSVSHNQE